MDFSKIQITKQGTLNVTYKNEDGDLIQYQGANIVHKDLKEAMQALVPHLALITEQREAHNKSLSKLREYKITDEGDNVFKRLSVDAISLSNGGSKVSISGSRILTSKGVISLNTPNIDIEEAEDYDYCNDLSLDVDAIKYEAQAYIEEKKWGVKQAEIKFDDIDPYKAEAGDVPEVEPAAPKKRGRKPKKVA